MNGIDSKLGLADEKLEVCQQWLRLLLERVETVTWEASDLSGFDQRGVDLWIEENGKRFAIQCKTKRAKNKWTPGELGKMGGKSSVWSYIQDQLIRRPDPTDEFWFSTNRPYVEGLSGLLEWAQSETRSRNLTRTECGVLALLGLENEPVEKQKHLLKKIKIQKMEDDRRCEDLTAGLVKPESMRDLINALRGIPEEKVLGKTLRKPDLLKILMESASSIQWIECDRGLVLETVQRKTRGQIDDLEDKQRYDFIQRRETGEWIGIASEPEKQGGRILVHGSPGSGKSFVLLDGVRKLLEAETGYSVLFTSAYDLKEFPPELSPESLKRVYGEKIVVVVDQWDSLELFHDPGGKQKAFQYCRRCLELNLRLVVGCRTVDAKDSSLHSIFITGLKDHLPPSVEVGPLPESEITRVLDANGIPWNRLGPDTQKLVRNPECLGMLLELARADGLSKLTPSTVMDLAFKWMDACLMENPGAKTALDAVMAEMERRGGVSVPPALFRNHASEVQHLQNSGILQKNSKGELEIRHQILLDVYLAQKLGTSSSPGEFLQGIPSREQQNFLHARRVRQALSVLVHRKELGILIMHEVFTSASIRPLVKRGLLLGLADMENPGDMHWNMVAAWLTAKENRDQISTVVFAGHAGWMKQYLAWAMQHSETLSIAHRRELIHWLASVSCSMGDEIAEALETWRSTDPELMNHAEVAELFWQSPAKDSDRMFQTRLDWPGLKSRVLNPDEYTLWRNNFKECPERAASLLGKYFEFVDVRDLTGYQSNRSGVLRVELEKLPEEFVYLGEKAVRILAEPWRNFCIPVYTWDENVLDLTTTSLLGRIVQALAKTAAKGLRSGGFSFDEWIACLSNPMRRQDVYLMLVTLLNLDDYCDSNIYDQFTDWLQRTPDAIILKIHTTKVIGAKDYIFDEAVMDRLISGCSPVAVHGLLDWMVNLKPELSCYRLLGLLSPELRVQDASANTRFLDLEQKLGSYPQRFPNYEEFERSVYGVEYTVSTEEMAGWNPERWIREFQAVQASEEHGFLCPENNTYCVKNPERLMDRFRHFASLDPLKYFRFAQAITTSGAISGGDIASRLIRAVSIFQNPHGDHTNSSWEKVSSKELEDWLLASGLLCDSACFRAIAEMVGERAEDAWSGAVYGHLMEIAKHPAQPEDWEKEEKWDLQGIQFHHPNTRALWALSRSIHFHKHLVPDCLELAETLVDAATPAVKTELAQLAAHCLSEETSRSVSLILQCAADPQCRMQFSTMEVLWHIICSLENEEESRPREEAISSLLKVCESSVEDIARQAGFYAYALLKYDMISLEKLRRTLEESPVARSSLAWAVGKEIDEQEPPDWCWDLALELAADSSRVVRQQLATRLSCSDSKRFMGNKTFVLRLLETPLARDSFADLERLLQESVRLAWFRQPLIGNAETLLDEIQKKEMGPDSWECRQRLRETETLLTRLIEELTHEGDIHALEPALNVYDKLIDALPGFGLNWLEIWSK